MVYAGLQHVTKQCKRDQRDIIRIPCICEKGGILKIVMQVLKEQELSNKENVWSGKLTTDKNEGPSQNVTENDVVEVLCSMKAGKVEGPSGITLSFPYFVSKMDDDIVCNFVLQLEVKTKRVL